MNWRTAILMLSSLLLFVIACGGESDGNDGDESPLVETPAATVEMSTPLAAGCDPARPHDTGRFDRTIMSGGLEREYILHVPASYDGTTPMPVVLLFHGFALDGKIMYEYTELGPLADREGFIVVSPTGAGDPHRWSSGGIFGDEVDDVQFVDDLLAEIDAELCTDPSRTFATGYSNGGGMSMRLACDRSDRISAVGLVASVYAGCTPQVPMIGFHGSQDAFGPADEQELEELVQGAVAGWADAIGCAPEPDVVQVSEHIERTAYSGCAAGGRTVQMHFIDGGGHTWPGGAEGYGDPAITTYEISASELIWDFFSEFGD